MSTPVDARSLQGSYEALRQEALGVPPDGPPSHGLALFLLRGMPAWCAVLTALGPPRAAAAPPAVHSSEAARPQILPETRATLTTVLTGMVLSCLSREEVAG
jgi:hypothetical protein